MFKPCLIIPVYKHAKQFEQFAKKLPSLPLIVVDDGNDPNEKNLLEKIAAHYKAHLIVMEKNCGKTAALTAGAAEAEKLGYTHALQIDADGQHNVADIKKFLEIAQKNPHAIINGYPEYDETVPKSRLHGRKITNFWVDIETKKGAIKDAMCGFRVYPLKEMQPLFKKGFWFKKMGGDIEIIVKSYFHKVKIINVETKVIYPQDGFSNFKMFRDNVKISLLHSLLVSTMILRKLLRIR